MAKKLLSATVVCIIIFIISPCFAGEKKRLVLSTMNWEPYYAKQLLNGGPVTEITKEAFKKAGYEVLIKFVPWKRALEKSKTGKYDGLMGAYFSDDRARYFAYTDKIVDAEVVLVRKKESVISYTSLQDLKPYRVGVLRGGSVNQEFDTAAYLTKIEVGKHEQGIGMLMAGRVDLIVLGKFHFLKLIHQKYPRLTDKVTIITPPLRVNSLFNTISKRHPDHKKIVTDFNRGLAEINRLGIVSGILEKHGLNMN